MVEGVVDGPVCTERVKSSRRRFSPLAGSEAARGFSMPKMDVGEVASRVEHGRFRILTGP